jgi:hypothetical protein
LRELCALALSASPNCRCSAIGLIVWSVMTGVTGIVWSFPGFGTFATGAQSDMFA